MQNLADRIRAVRKKLGINQQQLADILGCSDGKIKGWEQGNTLSMKPLDIFTLEKKFGFNQEWLENGEGEMMTSQGDLLLKDIAQVTAIIDGNLSIPYYKDIQASAGHGCINGECISTQITISRDMLPFARSNYIEAIRVSGNSMSPTIEDEYIIFIDKNDTEPLNGKIYVVFLCDEVYVKRIFIEPKSKSIVLSSDNPIFPQLKADCEDFRIIGRVIASMSISKL